MTKHLLIIVFLTAFPLMAKSQTIENDLNVYFSVSVNKTLGNQSSVADNIMLPALYSNYKESKSGSLAINHKLNRIIRLGVKYKYNVFNNWAFQGSDLYNDSEISQNIVSVTSQYTLIKFKKNHFNLISQFNPYVGNASVKLSDDITGFIPSGNPDFNPGGNNLIWGFEGSIGIDLMLFQAMGIVVDAGINKGWTKSGLIKESDYLNVFSGIGVYFRFLKDRKFKYD